MPDARGLDRDADRDRRLRDRQRGHADLAGLPGHARGRRDLIAYCAEHATTFGDHRADAEAWAAILFGDASVGIDGTVRASSTTGFPYFSVRRFTFKDRRAFYG